MNRWSVLRNGFNRLIRKEGTYTNKEEPITLNAKKLLVVANVINVACMSSTSLNGKDYFTGGKENLTALRCLGSRGIEASSVIMGAQHIGIKIDLQNPSSSETLSIQHSYDEKDCHTYPKQIMAVMEQGEQKLNTDVVQAYEAAFKMGWVDND